MLDVMRQHAARDSVGNHAVVDNAEEADIILFVESAQFDDYLYKQLRQHPLVARYPRKVFMYNEVDKPWCALPGLYGCMPKRYFQSNRQVAFGFVHTPNDFVKSIYEQERDAEREYLFSFVGALSHRCRKHIMALSERTPSVQDTSDFNVWHCSADVKASQGQNFADIMASSHFVLCPRGLGTSSFRLFEAMEAGRAPVIISNQWVAPDCVDWDFAVRIPEHDIQSIPGYLAAIADEAKERGEAARKEWEKTFARDRFFDTAVSSVAVLADSRQRNSSKVYLQNLRKVLVKGEMELTTNARKIRDRVTGISSTPSATPDRVKP